MEFINRGPLQEVRCNVCGSENYRILYKASLPAADFRDGPLNFGISSASIGHPQIVSCNGCGLMYANPRETVRDLLNNYMNVQDERYLFEEKNRRETFSKALKFIEKYCSKKGKLLDIGCFTGLFMDTARQKGWDAVGIDPSSWASEYGRRKLDLNIITGTLDSVSFPDNHFDLISMWDSLEHMPDPKKAIALASGSLKDKGVMVINTPDFGSVFSKVLRENFWFIERTHLYYFTAQTLRKLLNNSGLDIVSIKRHWRKLSLGYLIERMEAKDRLFSKITRFLCQSASLRQVPVYFYPGQMTVIAAKTGKLR